MRPRYAFVADDFTGATDTLATLAFAGLKAALHLDARTMAADATSEAVGLATAARALAPDAMAAALAPAAAALRALAAPVSHYKICSTFDSAPAVGNIAAAVAALRAGVPGDFLPIVGGQPNLRRYCVFGTLYAGAGADGPIHRIDRHPTMSRHPVTPMHEADLRRHLASQGLDGVATVDVRAYAAPLDVSDGPVLFDVLDDAQLAAIGELLLARSRARPLLAVGASGVATAMIAAWRREGSLAPPAPPSRPAPARGPVFALAGSQSPVTAAQRERAASYATVERTDDADADARRCIDLLRAGRHVLATSGPPRGERADAVAAAGARLLATVVDAVAPARIGVAGGDTSSHAVQALGIERLEVVAPLDRGVALCRARGRRHDGLELMLKGGQMGAPDVFERLIEP